MALRKSLVVGLLALSCLLGGCTQEQAISAKEAVAASSKAVQAANAQIELLRESLKGVTDSKTIDAINRGIERSKEERAKAEEILKSAELHLADAQDSGDLLVGVVQTAAPFMGPYGGVAVLGATLLGGYLKNNSTKKKGHQAIQNIDDIIHDPDLGGGVGKFNAKDPETARAMRELDRNSGVGSFVKEALGG